jgi:hypothetical protein
MAEDSRFQGDWNANKGYLQLMIDYISIAGQYNINEDIWHQYKTTRQLYKITNGVIDPKVTEEAGLELDAIKRDLDPKDVDRRTPEGQSVIQNRKEEAELKLEKVEMALIANIHKNNLILPKKMQQKGIRQLWEEYGLEDDNNTEGAGEDNNAILPPEPETS